MQLRSKLFSLLLGAALLAVQSPNAFASNSVMSIELNGRPLFLPNPPVIRQDRVLVPMRGYLEAIGARLEYRHPDEVTAYLNGKTMQFTLGSSTARADGTVIQMDVPAQRIGETGYLPLRFLSEGLNANVQSDGQTVRITTPSDGRIQIIDGPLNVRSSASTLAPILTALPIGTVLDLNRPPVNGWNEIRLPKGRTGWVSGQFTRPIGAAPSLEAFQSFIDNGSGYLQVGGDCIGFAPIDNGKLLVPLRETVQRMGGEIGWDGSVIVRYGGHEIALFLGSKQARIDGNTVQLDFVPTERGGLAFVPARAFATWFNLGLEWDGLHRTAILRTPFDTGTRTNTCNPSAPVRAYMVMDAATGLVLSEHRADVRTPIASTTKIMTAVLAVERGNPDQIVTISPRAASQVGTSVGLRAGEQQRLQSLLFGLMLVSGNDAATAIAEHLSGDETYFARLMNQRAEELGANDTLFYNASGLDDYVNPYSTARDLTQITRHGLANPDFRALVSAKEYTIPGPTRERQLKTLNDFVKTYPGATGVKNGWTDKAGYTLVTSAFREGREIIVVVLGATNRTEVYRQAPRLMDLGFSLARSSWLLKAGAR